MKIMNFVLDCSTLYIIKSILKILLHWFDIEKQIIEYNLLKPVAISIICTSINQIQTKIIVKQQIVVSDT